MTPTTKNTLLALLGLVLACAIFYFPNFTGKKLSTGDNLNAFESAQESKSYLEKGESVFWTKSVFSGMPNYIIYSKTNKNFFGYAVWNFFAGMPTIFAYMLYTVLCFFIALKLFKISSLEAMVFAIIFGINTWVVDSLVNGHGTKIMTYGSSALIFSSFYIYVKSKNNLMALLAFMLGLSMNLFTNHTQETYYAVILCVVTGFYLLYEAIKEKTLPNFFLRIGYLVIAAAIAFSTNVSSLYNLQDYSKDTMRGGVTELTPIAGQRASTSKTGGLDVEYAFSWSYKFTELFNFIVPNAAGGSSSYTVKTKDSKLAQGVNYASDKITLPMYFGGQPFTSGPNYIGAIVMFLFVFYLFYTKSKIRWLLIIISVLSIFMGLGKYFLPFNEVLFEYLPFYNKFRTPTMAFSMINIVSVIGAALVIRDLWFEHYESDHLIKTLKNTGIFFGVVIVIFTVMISNQGFESPGDAGILQQQPNFPLDLLKEDREAFFRSDLFRTIFLMLVVAAGIWAIAKDKLKHTTVIYVLLVLSVLELWTVSKRYYSDDIFQDVPELASLVPYEAYNQVLDADNSYYRVFNTTVNSFNDNTDGYRYANVGGYSPAKLYRYQDLIDRQLSKGNQAVYDMLNTKYFIVNNQGQKMAQQNPGALGVAWFVNEVKFVPNADAEMDSMNAFNPKRTAIVDQRYKADTKFDGTSDDSSRIDFVSYYPDTMRYASNSKSGGYAVFSEIWYRGNTEWKAYIDGVEQKIVRTNYLLRGMYVPAGNHKIEFVFAPKTLIELMNVTLIGTIIMLLMSLFLIWQIYSQNKNTTKAAVS